MEWHFANRGMFNLQIASAVTAGFQNAAISMKQGEIAQHLLNITFTGLYEHRNHLAFDDRERRGETNLPALQGGRCHLA